MLPKGSIFFSLKVAPMRIENNFKGHQIKNANIEQRQYFSLLKSLNFDAPNIKWFTVPFLD